MDEILKSLAPCGLDCSRCFGCKDGEINRLSNRLLEIMGDFHKVADRLSSFTPVFKNFSNFKEMLNFFAEGSCLGCRQGGGKFPLCAARLCFKEKGVDFCFQCDEYPCQRNKFDPALLERWRRMNDRMKEVGVEKFFQEQKLVPRY